MCFNNDRQSVKRKILQVLDNSFQSQVAVLVVTSSFGIDAILLYFWLPFCLFMCTMYNLVCNLVYHLCKSTEHGGGWLSWTWCCFVILLITFCLFLCTMYTLVYNIVYHPCKRTLFCVQSVIFASGQGSSLIICAGILTGYTDTLYKMLSQLSGRWFWIRLLIMLFSYLF